MDKSTFAKQLRSQSYVEVDGWRFDLEQKANHSYRVLVSGDINKVVESPAMVNQESALKVCKRAYDDIFGPCGFVETVA